MESDKSHENRECERVHWEGVVSQTHLVVQRLVGVDGDKCDENRVYIREHWEVVVSHTHHR